MIIDVHTHVSKLPNSRYSESFEKNFRLLRKEVGVNGIGRALILAGFRRKDDLNISTRSLVKLLEGQKGFYVVGGVDILHYTRKDVRDFDRWLKAGDIVGIKVYTGYQHFYPQDKRCVPIYKLCIKHDVPVMFHSGDTLAGYVDDPKVKYSHPIHIDDVATNFPELKIVIAHMGNPWLIDCAEVVYKNPNVYADISGLVVGTTLETPYGRMMRQRIKDFVAYTEAMGKLLYGTDWPLSPMDSYLRFARSLDLPPEWMDKLFYKNAIKLFKLKV